MRACNVQILFTVKHLALDCLLLLFREASMYYLYSQLVTNFYCD